MRPWKLTRQPIFNKISINSGAEPCSLAVLLRLLRSNLNKNQMNLFGELEGCACMVIARLLFKNYVTARNYFGISRADKMQLNIFCSLNHIAWKDTQWLRLESEVGVLFAGRVHQLTSPLPHTPSDIRCKLTLTAATLVFLSSNGNFPTGSQRWLASSLASHPIISVWLKSTQLTQRSTNAA